MVAIETLTKGQRVNLGGTVYTVLADARPEPTDRNDIRVAITAAPGTSQMLASVRGTQITEA